jgi:hypothetical protein
VSSHSSVPSTTHPPSCSDIRKVLQGCYRGVMMGYNGVTIVSRSTEYKAKIQECYCGVTMVS